jgi:1,5-anhydro-D-fructose reductase (1,5-anhydro-D-mannitol-forming)
VDAVYVSTVNRLHGGHTLLAAGAGKHVLCEKPVAMDLAEAWSMVRVCEVAGVVFGVNHHLPAHTTHTEIRRLVPDGAVGRPMSVRVFFSFELAERLRGRRLTDADLGGPIFDLMPHVASVVNKLIGLPLDAAAMAVRQRAWAPSWRAKRKSGRCRSFGTRAMCRAMCCARPTSAGPRRTPGTAWRCTAPTVRWSPPNVMRADPGGWVTLQDSSGPRGITFTQHRDAYEATLEAFARTVAGGGDPSISGLEALHALAVTLAVKRAGVTGRTVPIDLEPPG